MQKIPIFVLAVFQICLESVIIRFGKENFFAFVSPAGYMIE
jgi:hypothetical protein